MNHSIPNQNEMPQPQLARFFTHASKLSTFVLLGAASCFALFVLMSELIRNDEVTYTEPTEVFEVGLLGVKQELPETPKPKPLPEPPKSVTPPPPRPQPVGDDSTQLVAMTDLTVRVPTTQLGPIDFAGPRDNTAMPIVRVQPKYPIKAARDGIEGWVSLSFSIDPLGRVTNVDIIDSQPKRLFDQAARKALKRWKYKPQIKDGKAIKVDGQSVLLEFKLGQS